MPQEQVLEPKAIGVILSVLGRAQLAVAKSFGKGRMAGKVQPSRAALLRQLPAGIAAAYQKQEHQEGMIKVLRRAWHQQTFPYLSHSLLKLTCPTWRRHRFSFTLSIRGSVRSTDEFQIFLPCKGMLMCQSNTKFLTMFLEEKQVKINLLICYYSSSITLP